MQECTNCGASLKTGQEYCHICGIQTPYQKKQRVCINCGTAVAEKAKICIMCGHAIDSLPRQATSFGTSWLGIAFGLAVIAALAYWFFQFNAAISGNATPSAVAPVGAGFIVPTSTPSPTRTLSPTPAPSLTFTPTATPVPVLHTIKTGENLSFIADKYRVTVEQINAANNLEAGAILSVGQVLIIPVLPPKNAVISAPAEDTRVGPVITYTIKGGDTLSGIAFEYDTSVSAIESANPDVNLALLSVGQEIVVPLQPPTYTPTPTITPTPTFTPRPPFRAPDLLLPADGLLIEGDLSTVLLSWSITSALEDNIFYVVYLTDDQGRLSTFPTRASSYRLPAEARPTRLTAYSWYVVVMEKIGIDQNGIFYGKALSDPSLTRTFQWR